MSVLTCERCGGESKLIEKCMGCGKKICRTCIKSQKKLHKMERMPICRDCWGNLAIRSKFKSAR